MIILENNNMKKLVEPTYIALGNFDGLHRGHMALINRVVDEALLNDAKSLVYTFTNHPLTVAAPERAPGLIMDMDQKLHVFKSAGIDYVALVDFTYEYMQTSAEDFIKILLDQYHAKGLVVGFNYKYGYKNTGDVEFLKELAEKYDFEVIIIEPESDEEGLISSTRIRRLIQDGKVADAAKLLVEPFRLTGEIIPGRNNGRAMGFPTANMTIDEKSILPKDGVYYTNVEIDGDLYRGITSIGNNPTIPGENPVTVETYILDFEGDLYGKAIHLYFLEWMREMIKFDSMEELKEQIRKDNNYAATRNLASLRVEK